MALTYDELESVSSPFYTRDIVSQVYELDPFIKKLRQNNAISTSGGTDIRFPIRYKELDLAEWVNPKEQIAYQQRKTRTSGILNWKYLVGKTMMQWDEQVQNNGKEAIINLQKDKADELIDDLYEKFTDALYATTQDDDKPSSLNTIIDSADSYAGISVSDVSNWASTERTETQVVLYNTAGALATSMNSATFGPHKPDLMVTTRNLWNTIESKIEPQKRFYNEKGVIGFNSLVFHGADIIAASHVPTGYLYGVCSKFWELRAHTDFNFKVDKWKDLHNAGFPNAIVKLCYWVGNVKCSLRKVNFKYTALDYTA